MTLRRQLTFAGTRQAKFMLNVLRGEARGFVVGIMWVPGKEAPKSSTGRDKGWRRCLCQLAVICVILYGMQAPTA